MSSAKVDGAAQAAQSLESYFLRRVLSEVRSTEDSSMDGGFAGGMFKEMLDESLADAMSKAGGVGIASVVQHQLEPAAASGKAHTLASKAIGRYGQVSESTDEKKASSLTRPGRPMDWR
jgi:Rod binding domain-containing protein